MQLLIKKLEINKHKKNIRIRVEVPFSCLSIGSGGKFITINQISVITYNVLI